MLIHSDEFEEEVGQSSNVKDLIRAALANAAFDPGSRALTMVAIMPDKLSFRVKYPAKIRMRIVTGIAAMVRPNSISLASTTTTTNWTVNPRKKKKSNLRRAM